MKLTVVIPTFNRPKLLKQVIDNLKRTNCEIIVVDDNSSTCIDVEDVQIIRNTENMGSSFSQNLGASYATNEWILFLNDDVFPEGDFFESLEPLTRVADVIGFKLVGEGVARIESVFNRLINILFGVDIPRTSGYCTFVPAVMLIRRDWFIRVGGYDVWAYLGNCFREESDLQMRLHKAGARIYYAANLSVRHVKSGGGYDKMHSMRKWSYYFLRNQVIFARRYYGFRSIVIIGSFALYMLMRGVRLRTMVKSIAGGLIERGGRLRIASTSVDSFRPTENLGHFQKIFIRSNAKRARFELKEN